MMNSSPSKLQLIKERTEAILRERSRKPEWLEPFLQTTYFENCPDHPYFRNEKNGFCINCNLNICQYCFSTPAHRHHKVIQVYKHVYKNVVSLSSIEKHMDSSKIQPYKCNKRLVLAMNALPHAGTAARSEIACRGCSRKLSMPSLYIYCSISCKVKAFEMKSSVLVPPYLSLTKDKRKIVVPVPKTKKRARKGNPQRAPFF